MKIYKTEPIMVIDDIPVFSKDDDYSSNYDEIADVLLESVNSGAGNPFMNEKLWAEAERDTVYICKKYYKPGDRILDIGVGLGRLLSYFDDVEKYGIDISVGMVKESRKKGIEACKGDVQELPYVDDYFDIILCTDVLEHVFDLNKTVSEMKRVLKPGGVLVVRVPNEENLEGYLAEDCPFEYVHLRMFSESSLTLFFTKVFQFERLTSKKTYYMLKPIPIKRFVFIRRCIKLLEIILCKLLPPVRKKLKRPVEVIVAFRNQEN